MRGDVIDGTLFRGRKEELKANEKERKKERERERERVTLQEIIQDTRCCWWWS